MIDVPLENGINALCEWLGFSFEINNILLHIDVLVFRNILNVQQRIEWVQPERQKKGIKMQ